MNKFAVFGCVISSVAVLCLSPGCNSYTSKSAEMREAWRSGNFPLAEKIASQEAASSSENDRLIWQLEYATVLRGMQKNSEAQRAFDAAAQTIDAWDERADILISKEAAATLTNLSALPYRGNGVDRIMLQTYRALNYLEAGNPDSARVALNAAFRAQSDAVERNRKNIEAAQESARENSVDLPSLENELEEAAAMAKENNSLPEFAVYADYVNPFTTWLHGIYFLYAGEDDADRERARKSLERVARMEPRNTFVAEDVEVAKNTPGDAPVTYVIFEYGTAPTLSTFRIDLFLSIPVGKNSTIAPVCIALPRLSRTRSDGVPAMRANGVPAQILCDMNRVIKTDFENAYPAVLGRTLTTAFLKTAASVTANIAAQEYAKRDGSTAASLVALGTILGTSITTYASTDADVRIWQTLPEYFSVVRLPTPASRRITVEVAGHRAETALLPGKVNVVFVKSVGFALEPRLNQFILSK